MDGPVEDIGSRSCVTRFVKTLLSIMEHGVKPHSKHLTEYFAFLYEFAKMGEEEVRGRTHFASSQTHTKFLYLLKTTTELFIHKITSLCLCLSAESVPFVSTSHLHHGPLLHGH